MRAFPFFVMVCCAASSCRGAPGPGHDGSEGAGQPRSMEVEIEAGAGPLFGTLLLPAGKGPFPGVVVIAGSGPTDRDGNNRFLKGPVDNLKELARHLAVQGFASLRYDKRGVGKTPSGDRVVDADVLVADAKAAFAFLAARPEVRKGGVALLGHSEGGLVAILASRGVNAAALVLVSTAGRPILQVFEEQIRALIDKGLQEKDREAAKKYFEDFMGQLSGTGEISLAPPPGNFSDDLKLVFTEVVKPAKVAIMRTLYTVDPAEKIVDFIGPILIIHGEGDAQVPLDDAKRLEAKLAGAGRGNYKLEVIPAMDHVLKQLGGDRPEPYDGPGRKLSRDFLDRLSTWLKEKLE
jgi:dienelactone hydrolase